MCEGPSKICGPIPPDPSLLRQHHRRPSSARGRLEGNCDGTLTLRMGPLAPDPVLFPGYYSGQTPAHRPRINPNATHILERGQKGIVGNILKLEGIRKSPVTSQKHRPPDFSRENVRRLREIQRRYKEQEAERTQSRPVPVKAFCNSSKYQNVASRVMTQLEVSNPSVKPQCQNFLKAHSNSGSAAPIRPPAVAAQRPTSSIATQSQDPKTTNFVRHNALAARKTVLRRSQSLTNLKDTPIPSAVKGQVPQYLQERKQMWRKEEEERQRNAPDPSAPAGYTRMPDSDKLETLKTLKNTHRTLVTELLSLPLKADNLSVCTRRAHLDSRLSEIEEAIKIFSRDRVYIKNDS